MEQDFGGTCRDPRATCSQEIRAAVLQPGGAQEDVYTLRKGHVWDLWAGATRPGCECHRDGNDEVLELCPALLVGHSPRCHHKPTHASLPAAEGLRQ